MIELEAFERLAKENAQAAPGFSIALVQDDRVLAASSGKFKVGEDRPMDDAVRFPIGQLKKPILALLAIYHSLRNDLDLDEPIEVRFPELAAPGLPSVTYRHIISQTTGVADVVHAEAKDLDWDALATHFRRRIQAFPPGAVWSQVYCGHVILSKAIEQAGKASVSDQIRDLVFAPLGIDPEGEGDRAAMHTPRPGRAPELARLNLSPLFESVLSVLSLPVREIALLGQVFSGRLNHPLAEAARTMHQQVKLLPRLGAASGEFVPDALSLGLVGYGGLMGSAHLGPGSTCGLLFDPKGSAVAAVGLNAPNAAGRDVLLMRILALVGARPMGASSMTAPMALTAIAGAYSGLAMGYETAWIGADGRCEVQFARDQVSCQIKPDSKGRLFLQAENKWSMPFSVFADPVDGGPALMIGASAFKRC